MDHWPGDKIGAKPRVDWLQLEMIATKSTCFFPMDIIAQSFVVNQLRSHN